MRPLGARCDRIVGEIRRPSLPSDASCTRRACESACGLYRRSGERAIWSSQPSSWQFSWTVASGTPARTMFLCRRRTTSGGLRSWCGLWSGIAGQTRFWNQKAGSSSESGSTKMLIRRQRGSSEKPGAFRLRGSGPADRSPATGLDPPALRESPVEAAFPPLRPPPRVLVARRDRWHQCRRSPDREKRGGEPLNMCRSGTPGRTGVIALDLGGKVIGLERMRPN